MQNEVMRYSGAVPQYFAQRPSPEFVKSDLHALVPVGMLSQRSVATFLLLVSTLGIWLAERVQTF
jgi:hypothetical protein